MPQGSGVQKADGEPLGQRAEIIQLIVAVDGGDHRGMAEELDQKARNVGLGAVAMDDLRLFPPDLSDQAVIIIGNEPGKKGGGADAGSLGRLRKIAGAQADQLQVVLLLQPGAESKDMGLRAAAVAAAGNMEYFHNRPPECFGIVLHDQAYYNRYPAAGQEKGGGKGPLCGLFAKNRCQAEETVIK